MYRKRVNFSTYSFLGYKSQKHSFSLNPITKNDILYKFTTSITVLELTITFYKKVTATKIESNPEIVPKI